MLIAQQGGAQCIEQLRNSLVVDILNNERISFGIEAPLFIPIPKFANHLSRGRIAEENRSCFAQAGAYVAILALHQMCWLFKNIHDQMLQHHYDLRFTFDINEWRDAGNNFLIWEALVSGPGHSAANDVNGHIADAHTAAKLFRQYERDELEENNNVMLNPDDISLSLIEVALLHSGAIQNMAQIRNVDIIVLKADQPIPIPQDVLGIGMHPV